MLMEPDEYTSQERALTDKAKELIEQHELDWGNGECFIQRDAPDSTCKCNGWFRVGLF